MATFTAKQAQDWVPPLVSDAGNAYCVYGEYTLTGNEVGADVIKMVKVPARTVVTGITVYTSGLGQDAGGNPVRVDVGTESEPEKFFNDLDVEDAGRAEYTGEAFAVGDNDLTVQVKLVNTPASGAGKKIQVLVHYIATNII